MKPKQYRPIILRTLQQAQGKYKTFEDFADYMISKMEDYEEMANMLAADGLIGELSATATATTNVILSPGDHAPLRVDVSDRIVPKESERQLTDDEIIRLKDKAIEKYRAELPPEIEVTPPQFKTPLKLKLNLHNSPGGMPFIRVAYCPHDSKRPEADSCQQQVIVTGTQPQSAAILSEIRTQAMGMYSPQPRVVVPGLPAGQPLKQRLELPNPDSTDAWGANAGEGKYSSSESNWGPSSAEIAASRMGK